MNVLKRLAIILLFVTAAIWGLSYSFQAQAMDTMPPLMFVFLRYLLGAFMLFPIIIFFRKPPDKNLISGGIICGICLAGGEILQQFGLLYTSAGKAGFLTALYVIMIPIIGVFIKKKSTWSIWIASLLSIVGTYLLCTDETFETVGNIGDALMLICALFFAFQFIAIAKFATSADAIQFSSVQFTTVAVLAGIATLVAGESCNFASITKTASPLLFCGIIAIGLACTIQIAAQKIIHPAVASIILSTASVFALIWGYLLQNECYSFTNFVGCGFIFTAVILVQLPSQKNKNLY